jgi:hypothetical protein
MECLNEVEDPRQASNGTRHDFQEILVIAICAMLSDSDSVEDFSEWGRLKLDGLRRSADGNASPVHMVSAFATDLGLALGQEKVSIDAMGCQREIAEKIVHKGGDYLLAVKGNQPTLYQQVRDLISDARGAAEGFEHVRHDHGRAVLQLSWSSPSGKEIDTALWPGCKSVGGVVSQRIVGEKVAELDLPKKIVLNLIRADKTDSAKTSLRLKRKRAAWDDDIRMKMLGIQPY